MLGARQIQPLPKLVCPIGSGVRLRNSKKRRRWQRCDCGMFTIRPVGLQAPKITTWLKQARRHLQNVRSVLRFGVQFLMLLDFPEVSRLGGSVVRFPRLVIRQ